MNFLKILLISCLLLLSSGLKAYPIRRTNNFSSYKDPLNEFGYGINAVFLKNENQLAPQLTIYYSRDLTNYFSIGVSYFGIYYKHYQNALAAKISFKIIDNLVFSFNPGIFFRNDTYRNQTLYFFGFESAYQFKLSDKIGIGPMFDLQIIQDDFYLIGGLQMAFYF